MPLLAIMDPASEKSKPQLKIFITRDKQLLTLHKVL